MVSSFFLIYNLYLEAHRLTYIFLSMLNVSILLYKKEQHRTCSHLTKICQFTNVKQKYWPDNLMTEEKKEKKIYFNKRLSHNPR